MTEVVDPQPALLRVIADRLPAMLAYWDADQRCRFANRAYEKWFGVDPRAIIGIEMRQLLGHLYPLNLPFIEAALRGEEQEFERDIPNPEGGPPRHSLAQYIPDVADGKVRGFCVLVTDITRLKKAERALRELERQLQANERLTALATLAAGIAHEINNPLAAVLGSTELALDNLKETAPDLALLSTDLVTARDNTMRIRDIVESMKLLARGDTSKSEIVDVNDVVQMSIQLASTSIRYRARIVRDLQPSCETEGNASQLAQVFVSLLTNAAQALPEKDPANLIRIVTRRERDVVVVEVSDNGCGIPKDLQERVFEPFFTTKPVGTGMGLGLSISTTIVKAFGGALSLESEPGRGSLFRVVLPAARQPATHRQPAMAPSGAGKPVSAPPLARPRLLIIDDERAVAQTLERVLARDCDVVVSNHGREAISLLLDAAQREFDVILCDLMMPDPSGDALYAEVTKQRPELAERFVFMTGGAFTPQGRRFLESVPATVLEKPFDLGRLRALVMARANQP